MEDWYPPPRFLSQTTMTLVAKTPPVISDVIAVICGQASEQCLFEKEVSLLTFSAWLSFPNNEAFITHARTVGTALLIDAVLGKSVVRPKLKVDKAITALMDRFWPTELLLRSLLQNPWGDIAFCLETTEMDAAAVIEIVEFLLRCPRDYKPSLNKALFFISTGGFQTDEDREMIHARSISTLKSVWTSFAVASPFLCAAKLLELPLRGLGADNTESISKLKKLLKTPQLMLHYFGVARFIQEELLERLTLRSRSNFEFVEFPKAIRALPFELRDLDSAQLRLVKKYRAPSWVKPAQA
jgi:hypothetical protein